MCDGKGVMVWTLESVVSGKVGQDVLGRPDGIVALNTPS